MAAIIACQHCCIKRFQGKKESRCFTPKDVTELAKQADDVSLGNFFEESLKNIIERGLNIKQFGQYCDTCWVAEDRAFIDNYLVKKIYGKPLPVPYKEVFTKDDFITPAQRQLYRT